MKTIEKVRLLLKTTGKPVKLNLGCGTDYKKGWINIDNNSDDNIEKLDLNWDLRKPLPFKDNSVDFVEHEHFELHHYSHRRLHISVPNHHNLSKYV